jgi:hypothetical protein
MTLERLEEIEARAEQATPVPWIKLYAIGQLCSVESASGNVAVAMSNEDCAFVISARTDVPALCRALREAWEVLAEWDEYRAYLLIHGFEHLPKWLPTVDALPEDGKR